MTGIRTRLGLASPRSRRSWRRSAHTEDDDLYGRALGRHGAALARLLRAPAPDLGAVAGKLDLIVRHRVSELAFGEASMAALRRDVLRIAALPLEK